MDYSAKFLEEIDNQGNLSFYYLSKEVQINVITAIKLKILAGKVDQKELSQYADLLRKIQSDKQDQEVNSLVSNIIDTHIVPNLSKQQEDVRDISSSSSSSSDISLSALVSDDYNFFMLGTPTKTTTVNIIGTKVADDLFWDLCT